LRAPARPSSASARVQWASGSQGMADRPFPTHVGSAARCRAAVHRSRCPPVVCGESRARARRQEAMRWPDSKRGGTKGLDRFSSMGDDGSRQREVTSLSIRVESAWVRWRVSAQVEMSEPVGRRQRSEFLQPRARAHPLGCRHSRLTRVSAPPRPIRNRYRGRPRAMHGHRRRPLWSCHRESETRQ
jgi:hypothetical protein